MRLFLYRPPVNIYNAIIYKGDTANEYLYLFSIDQPVILFYMNKIPCSSVPPPPFLTFFPVFLLPLGMPIDSKIMDGF